MLKSLSWRPDSIFARQRCVPPGDTGAVPSSSDTGLARPGAYALELVATTGSRSGAAATGHLVLDEAHQRDRSPRTGRAAYDWPADSTYLYGATDLEFRAVAAPREFIAGKDARTLAGEVLSMDEETFRTMFKKSPIKWAELAGLRRNARVHEFVLPPSLGG